MQRFAIYFAPPPETPLWRFGCTTLGYDAASGETTPIHPSLLGAVGDWMALTQEPRRYGFHATLKAPFEPVEGTDAATLNCEVARLARSLATVTLVSLEVVELGRFIALVPKANSNALQELAGRLTTGLDHLRRPMSEADRARRLHAPLSPRQRHYLDSYGYPYVMEEYRFHMTLTGPIQDPCRRKLVREALSVRFAAAVPDGPVMIDALSLFCQPRRNQPFHIVSRVPLPAP